MDEKLRVRFMSHVQLDCWTWIGSTNTAGYGQFGLGDRPLFAHRVSWEIHNGPIPDGRWVLHRCDNKRCVNPDHLFLGTPKDNVTDMMAKGRDRMGRRRLTREEDQKVLQMHEAGMSQSALSREFGIGRASIIRSLARAVAVELY